SGGHPVSNLLVASGRVQRLMDLRLYGWTGRKARLLKFANRQRYQLGHERSLAGRGIAQEATIPALQQRRLSIAQPPAGGQELVHTLPMPMHQLVDRPRCRARLAQPLDGIGGVAFAPSTQITSQGISRGGELFERCCVQAVDL